MFKDLKKEAECPLCLETLNHPKTLPCLHSFCLLCLNNLARFARRRKKTTIKCPVCLASFQIPEEGSFDGLPTSFHLNRLVDILALGEGSPHAQTCSCEDDVAACYCFDCNEFFCNSCSKVHNQMKMSRGHRNVFIQNLKTQDVEELIQRPVTCAEKYHEKETLDYYCRKCEVCICQKCVILNHKQHTVVDIQQAAEEQNVHITEVAEKVKAEIADYEIQMGKEAERFNKSVEEIDATRKNLRTTIEELIQGLKKHETAMNTKLDRIIEKKLRCHEEKQEHFELHVKQMKSFVEYCGGILHRNISPEVVGTKQAVFARCKELLNSKRLIDLEEPPLCVRYVSNNEISQIMQGRVVASCTDSSLSVAEGKGLKETEVGREATFTITTNNSQGQQCYCEDDQVTVKIQTSAVEVLNKTIKNRQNGEYFVSYTSEYDGQHEVMITVNGKLLPGSPHSVYVSPHQYKSLFSFGQSGKGQGEFDNPWDIAVSHKTGNIAVADCGNNRIQIFNPDGECLRVFNQKGSPRRRLKEPGSVAFTRSGDLIVVDSVNISLFTEAGKFLKHITSEHLKEAWRVFVAQDGCMVVCSNGDNSIKVLSSDGIELLKSFTAPDCNVSPEFAICYKDKFYVSFPEAHSIKAFSKEGVFLHNIGCDGAVQLWSSAGLAMDKYNNLLVCDTEEKKVHVFTLDGKFVNTFDGKLTGSNEPCSLAVSNTGLVYVIDVSLDNSIHVFQ